MAAIGLLMFLPTKHNLLHLVILERLPDFMAAFFILKIT